MPCHRLETRRRGCNRPQTRSQFSKFVQSSVGTSKCWRSRGGVVRFSFSPAVHSYLRHCELSCHMQAGYAPRRGIETIFSRSSTQFPQQASLCETFPGVTLGREPRTASVKSGCAKITQIGGKWSRLSAHSHRVPRVSRIRQGSGSRESAALATSTYRTTLNSLGWSTVTGVALIHLLDVRLNTSI